ncbi:putative porin [Aquabacterium sp.]|uniref:putative porin n=1 Tax=Aquabacterium sp. TaxID=1872578 RepID=UPI0019CE403A|nr:putative porin [Aquabacterium sp.]MBC7702015.1 putative porin [Aquabacterium sp.]
MNVLKKTWWPTLTALSLAMTGTLAHADERASLEALRQTTIGLIDALVDKGVLTREVADGMLKQAAPRATATDPDAPKPETTAAGKPVLRVPYVSDAMKAKIRNEVKEEVLTQARAERWGVPNATPSWVDRIKIDGDFRFRYQSDRPGKDNTMPSDYVAAEGTNKNGLSRAPDFASSALQGDNSLTPTSSTSDARERERIRLRLGVSARVADEVGVGIRLATGSATDRVSTNQTLGQNFNKYQLFVDRAFVRLDPADWVTVQAGRIPNPWFSTDMVWSDNLNFDGLAATGRWVTQGSAFSPFATLGWFPLREQTPPNRSSRWLMGAQVGTGWDVAARTKVKLGLAYYSYNNLEGKVDQSYVLGTNSSNQAVVVTGPEYGQYEYPTGLRQKGNTVFETNPTSVDTSPLWGLAYAFRPLVLTASAELTHFSPYSLLISGEYVKNMAFDEASFHRRAGAFFDNKSPGGKSTGYHFKLAFGSAEVREQGQWQLATSYRHVGSDAVLDAFTDSDLGLGGTNLQGYTLGGSYGLYRNTNLGVRFLSAKTIDTPLNQAVVNIGGQTVDFGQAKYKVNSLQVDLNVRF